MQNVHIKQFYELGGYKSHKSFMRLVYVEVSIWLFMSKKSIQKEDNIQKIINTYTQIKPMKL